MELDGTVKKISVVVEWVWLDLDYWVALSRPSRTKTRDWVINETYGTFFRWVSKKILHLYDQNSFLNEIQKKIVFKKQVGAKYRGKRGWKPKKWLMSVCLNIFADNFEAQVLLKSSHFGKGGIHIGADCIVLFFLSW